MAATDTSLVVRVGIADGAVVRKPQKLRTNGLGSCVGVVLYDAEVGVCGLVHIMLPQSPDGKQKLSPMKFADLGVVWLVNELQRAGARRNRLKAKIAGGAQMFSVAGGSDLLRIGPRNVEAVETALSQCSIPLIAKDVGGSQGRTIEFDSVSNLLAIRTAMKGTLEL